MHPCQKVGIALGTIESARLALLSFQGIANYDRIGLAPDHQQRWTIYSETAGGRGDLTSLAG